MKEEKEFSFDGTLIGQWLGFIAISMFLLKVLDVISWSWVAVFSPIWVPGVIIILGIIILSMAIWINKAIFSLRVKKCDDCEDGLKEDKNESI